MTTRRHKMDSVIQISSLMVCLNQTLRSMGYSPPVEMKLAPGEAALLEADLASRIKPFLRETTGTDRAFRIAGVKIT